MTDKSLEAVLRDLASQSSSGDGLNLTQLEAALRQQGCKIDDNYLAILRGLLKGTEDLTIANDLDCEKQTISNTKTKIRKHLKALLKAKHIAPPSRKKDSEYIPKLNEAGYQITVKEEKSLKDTIILVCKNCLLGYL